MRKYLKHIFNKLPRDLQIHILNFNNNTTKDNEINRINNYLHKITYKINNFSNIIINHKNNLLLLIIIINLEKIFSFFNLK